MASSVKRRLRCSLSVDVDSFDSLVRFYCGKSARPSGKDPVYAYAVPRFLKLFKECGVRATFFVVANDLKDSGNVEVLKEIAAAGHEVANHSLNHEFAFSSLARGDREEDIRESTAIITKACGRRPEGFRVPGYDVDETTIDILDNEGYLYDASVYKFPLYPLLRRAAYSKIKNVIKNPKFGSVAGETYRAMRAPGTAYRPAKGKFWRKGDGRKILEIPVSVMPVLSLPFNSTFLFLSGRKLFGMGLRLSEYMNMDLSYNFHSTDMLSSGRDGVNVPHPGINIDTEEKYRVFRDMINRMAESYDFLTLEAAAKGHNAPR